MSKPIDLSAVDTVRVHGLASRWYVTLFFSLSLLVLGVEGLLWWKISTEEMSWTLVLILHGTLSILLMGLTWVSWGNPILTNMMAVLTITTICLGVIGAFGTTVSMILFFHFRRSAVPFEEWYRELFPDIQENRAHEMAERLRQSVGEVDGAVIPFNDIMLYGSLRDKQAVVSMINQNFQPVLAPILRLAFRDKNNSLRVQAASVITKIEESFLAKTMRLEQEAKEHPQDVSVLLRYARHFDDYTFTGLLDPERERDNRIKATETYHRILALHPEESAARLALSRIMIRQGHLIDAASLIEETFAMGQITQPMLLWYFETLFLLKRYDDLERTIHEYGPRFMDEERYSVTVLETVKLWCVPCA